MYRPFDLTGKVALVTGGNSGIGLGMARAVAQAGADVAIWGTNPAKNAAAKSELATTGREIVTLECDVSDEQAVETAFGETLRLLGRVDGCFANAGVSGRSGTTSFSEMSAAEWRRVSAPCGDDLEAVAAAEAERLERSYPPERLDRLAGNGGLETDG